MNETVIVSGLIEKDNKILLIKAKVGIPKGLWNFPSGHIDEGEGFDQATIRETKEETGYDCEVEGLVGVYERMSKNLPKENIVIRTILKLKIVGGELNTPEEEISEAKWFTKEEVQNLRDDEVTFAIKESISNYFDRGFVKQKFYSIKKDYI